MKFPVILTILLSIGALASPLHPFGNVKRAGPVCSLVLEGGSGTGTMDCSTSNSDGTISGLIESGDTLECVVGAFCQVSLSNDGNITSAVSKQ